MLVYTFNQVVVIVYNMYPINTLAGQTFFQTQGFILKVIRLYV